ncbi:MAG: hypothetical protein LKE39_00630 [Sphaerochaeta sp.]|jgi:hypothetical protein|nr:hypothetical protein [Sphaerochaeta sp.]MCH3919002.1 hypothetical protein [Sphaerochaeta sp.]MCI2044920.1 hypothetical protein [Sphaerochaeta sp.]MCI2075773.1 hypothetical protein [Sphaerochaeta sp.]MCI2096454.1 hypothetical protein [Sphaerochaeta sp.]
MRTCHFCHAPIDDDLFIGPETLCEKCHMPLHSCVNCTYYEPGAYHDCHEGVEEEQPDKEEENYCDSFQFGDGGSQSRKDPKAAKAKAEALFKF